MNRPLSIKIISHRWVALVYCLLLASCATPPPIDYTSFRANLPRSILVLPPQNETVEVNASYEYLATITRPLAEYGYYVFPVAVVDAFMRDNGIAEPAEMHQIPLAKLRDVFGADTVLYVTLEQWGTEYAVVTSATKVELRAQLVDTATAAILWQGGGYAEHRPHSDTSGGIIGLLLSALVSQVANTLMDRSIDVARSANAAMMYNQRNGFLVGPRHPLVANDPRGR